MKSKFGDSDDDSDGYVGKFDPYSKPSRGGGRQVNQGGKDQKQSKQKMNIDNDEDFPTLWSGSVKYLQHGWRLFLIDIFEMAKFASYFDCPAVTQTARVQSILKLLSLVSPACKSVNKCIAG